VNISVACIGKLTRFIRDSVCSFRFLELGHNAMLMILLIGVVDVCKGVCCRYKAQATCNM
jgi:hypothetical protein